MLNTRYTGDCNWYQGLHRCLSPKYVASALWREEHLEMDWEAHRQSGPMLKNWLSPSFPPIIRSTVHQLHFPSTLQCNFDEQANALYHVPYLCTFQTPAMCTWAEIYISWTISFLTEQHYCTAPSHTEAVWKHSIHNLGASIVNSWFKNHTQGMYIKFCFQRKSVKAYKWE